MSFLSSSRFLRWLCLGGLLGVLVLLAGCGGTTFLDGISEDRMSTFDVKGPIARMQLGVFEVTLWVSLFLFVTVGGALAWAVWRYREKPEDRDKPPPKQSHGHPAVEMGLIAASVLMLVIIAVPTLDGIWMMHDLERGLALTDEEEVLEVIVHGYQWWWAFEYPEYGFTTANELVIPKDRVVKLHLRGQDVIHSFWLPKIAGKTDLMPGRANWMWLLAEEEGHYYGQCAEYCGEAHAYMLFRTDVLSKEGFDDWIAHQQSPAEPPAEESWQDWYATWTDHPEGFDDPVQQGARLFMTKGGCIQCHAIDGSQRAMGVLGPDLTHVGSRKSLGAGLLENRGEDGEIDPAKQLENLFEWVAHSEDHKPGNLMWKEGAADGLWARTVLTEAEKDRIQSGQVERDEVLASKLSEEDYRLIAHYLRSLK